MANPPLTPSSSTIGVTSPSVSSTTPLAGVAPPDNSAVLSNSAPASANNPGQQPITSSIPVSSTPALANAPIPSITSSTPTTPLSSTLSIATSSSSSRSPQNSSKALSTSASQSSASSSAAHASSTTSSTPHRLSNGAVAGVVIAVAAGIALVTFLATFLIMRRQQPSKGKRRHQSSKNSEGFELRTPGKKDQTSIAKRPFVTEVTDGAGAFESYLPQSADDSIVQQRTKATLDQLELHVENFYQKSSSSTPRIDNGELARFDSPYLPASLAVLLPRSKNRVNVIKHVLALFVTSSISASANPARSLLPSEYALLPNTVTKAMSSVSAKAGFAQIMSRWRVMTAYLRPDPATDAAYIAQRDKQISNTVQSFGKAFAPWKSTGYKDEERARSLSAILEDAANLGIFLFSQPSTLNFHWPSSSEVGPGRIVVSPALVKRSDEKGQDLVEAQVMVKKVVLDA